MGRKATFNEKLMMKVAHLYPPCPTGMKHFPLIVVGANLGSFTTRNFVHHAHGLTEQACIFPNSTNQFNLARYALEEGRLNPFKYLQSAAFGVELSANIMSGLEVSQYLPEQNKVVLSDGQELTYDHLVISQGRPSDWAAIPGLEQALLEADTPVFSSITHPEMPNTSEKHLDWLYKYRNGDAYFYIPPFPFKGEIGAYNFLAAASIWNDYKKLGLIPQSATFTVINANDKFCQFEPETDQLFRDMCENYGVNVQFNTTLDSIQAADRTMQLTSEGQSKSVSFDNLYVIPPSRTNPELMNAGLASQSTNGLLDVDHVTLQTRNFDNVWGVGEVNNLPVTASYFSGLYQSHLVANNVYRLLGGKTMNSPFNGYSKSFIYTARNRMTQSIYDFNGARQGNLLDSGNGPLSYMRYVHFSKTKLGLFEGVALGKKTNLVSKNFERKQGKILKNFFPMEEISRTNTLKDAPAYSPDL